jgi:YtkA-like protein
MSSITAPRSAARAKRNRVWKWVAGSVAALALMALAAFGFMLYRMNYVPSDLDLSTTRLSNQGAYQVSYTPRRGPIVINQIHSWTLHLATRDGQPVTDAVITVDGDMPQHGHGLPTQPQVTSYLGNGDYLVEGMKFQMGGWWVVDFTIDARGQRDTVRFNMILK